MPSPRYLTYAALNFLHYHSEYILMVKLKHLYGFLGKTGHTQRRLGRVKPFCATELAISVEVFIHTLE